MSEAAVSANETWVRSVVTTAGDVEREAKSRLYNATEALGIYLLVLVTLWPFCFYFGKVLHNEFIQKAANVPLTLGALYLLFVSPFVHRDTAESWGLGNPWRLWALLKVSSPLKRAIILGAMLAMIIGLNYANVLRWPDVAKFIGLRDTAVAEFNDPAKHPFGLFAIIPFGLVVSSLLVTCAIRYDNFVSAFVTALKIASPLMAMTFLGAFAARGTAAFQNFNAVEYALGVFGYVFWGALQQLLFSSYFGTRIRKAFGPSISATNVIPRERRWFTALSIGACISAVLTTAGYIACLELYGIDKAPPALILWFIGASLPFASAWGYFYTVDRKRMLVATLCGSFFGLIHIASYGLVAVTFLLGVMLVYAFMEDKNRNLVALGFVHGLLGSTFGWLFGHDEAGALHVNYSVGPWNIHDPYITSSVLIFPMLCIAGYLALLTWCVNNLKEDDAAYPAASTNAVFAADSGE